MGDTLMKKKLTDEEIVKDIERSTGMPTYWKNIVLNLIHRLQAENAKKDKYISYLQRKLNQANVTYRSKL